MNIVDKRSSILKNNPTNSTMEAIDAIDKRKLFIKQPVEPVDFEQFQSKNKMLLMNDPNRDLVMFPNDDIKLSKVERDFRTENASVPENADAYADNLLAKQSVEFFTSSWTLIDFKYSHYGGSYNQLPKKRDSDSRPIPPPIQQKFEVDEKPEDDGNQLSSSTKGQSYFEGQLTICSKDEYDTYKRRKEELTLRSATSTTDLASGPSLKEFCLKQLNDNTHQIEEIKKESNPTILFLDSFQTVREIGKAWLLLERIDNLPEVYLFTGGKENNQKWLNLLRTALQEERDAKNLNGGSGPNPAEGDHADSARGCLQKYSQESEQTLFNWRNKDHQKILAVCPEIRMRFDEIQKFHMDPSKFDSSVDLHEDDRLQPFTTTPEIIQQYKITCSSLKMGLQAQIDAKNGVYRYDNPEPFFLSLCLIHIHDGRRISEEFTWDPNSPDISDMLREIYQSKSLDRPGYTPTDALPSTNIAIPQEAFAKCKTCIVNSAYSEDQVYILVRIEKVLQGAVSAATDKYTKAGSSFGPLSTFEVNGSKDSQPSSNDLKIGSQVHKAMSVFCRNIGHYRMPFAWGARPLSSNKTEVRLYKHDSNKLSEEDLIKHVQQLARQDRVIKWQAIPALLSIHVEPVEFVKEETVESSSSNPTHILNSSLIPMNKLTIKSSTAHPPQPSHSSSNLPSSQLSLIQPPPLNVIKQLESFLYDPSTVATMRELENVTGTSGSATAHPMSSSSASLSSNTANTTGSSTLSGAGSTSTQLKWGRDTTGLPVPEALVLPHLEYKNLLYVYPKCLNFSNQNCFTRARTLACFVEVRDSDDVDNCTPLKIVCARPSPYHDKLETWSNTSATYHDTSPHFTEEVKISLPPNLSKKHHLLFKFYHVSCDTAGNVKEKNSGKRHLETPVGYAWINLLSKDNNITTGLHNLPVSTNLPSGYLNYKVASGIEAPHLQWVDSQKNLFVVTIRLKSSIFTSSAHLHRFFRTCQQRLGQMQVQTNNAGETSDSKKNSSGNENGTLSSKNSDSSSAVSTLGEYHIGDVEVQNALKGLAALDLCTLLQFLPPLLNQLLQIVTSVTSSQDVPKLAVCTLGILVSHITGKGPDKYQKIPDEIRLRNTRLLKTYVKFAFDSDRVAVYRTQSVHLTLVSHLLNFMSEKSLTDKLDCYRLVANNWFFLNIITKSMVQYLFNTNKIKADRQGDSRFPAKFQSELSDLFNCMTDWIFDMSQNNTKTIVELNELARAANFNLSKFVCRLLNIMDRGFVFRLIHSYVNKLYERRKMLRLDLNLCLMEYEFIRELCQHEHFVQLNLPSISRSYPKEPGVEFFLTEEFLQKHYLIGLLLQLVSTQLSDPHYRQVIQFGPQNQAKPQPIVALRNLLGKHALDDRYSTKAQQARIAQLYLPLVNILIEYKSHLCMPGMHYHQQSSDSHQVDTTTLSKISNSSRPQSLASETTSLFSNSTSLSGGLPNGSAPGAGNVSVTSTSTDNSSQSSHRYLNKEGKVESSVLNAIAGMSGGNISSLRMQAQSRRSGAPSTISRQSKDSDQVSISSTSTLTQSVLASLDAVTASYSDDAHGEANNESQDQDDVTPEPPAVPEDKPPNDPLMYSSMPINNSGSHSGSLTRSAGRGIRSFGVLLEDDSQGGSLKSGQTGGGSSYYEEGSRSLGRRGFAQFRKNHDAKNKKRAAPQPLHINERNHRDVLVSFLHILSTVSTDSLTSLLNDMPQQNRLEFLDLLHLSIQYMHYRGHRKIDTYQSIGKCQINFMVAAKAAQQWRAQTRHSMASTYSELEQMSSAPGPDDSEAGSYRSLLEGNLSTEAGLIVIDVVCLYLNIFRRDIFSNSADHPVFKKIVSLFISFLQTNQSECTLKHLFAALRLFVTKFSKILFESSCSVIADLCLEALNCLNRHLQSTRTEACGLLYTMMRVSYDEFGKPGFNRVHQQIIISVSKLAGRIERGFELSLSQLNMLAQTDIQRLLRSNATGGISGQLARSKNASRQFVEEVSELTRCIRTVLMANTQMKEHENDPEMLVDLQYSLARSYASNPALRRTWLQAILKVHQDHKAKTEVAMVKIHEAALIAEYLKRKNCYPQGCSVFSAISPNIEVEESDMKGNFEQLEVSYTEEDLQNLLRESAYALDDAGLWEVMPHIYRLLIPVYENGRDLKELGNVYRHLAEGYQKAHHEEESGHRLFGEYYRVCFYGQPFETLAGKTFVYKADKCTELASMCSRLMKIFQGKFKQNVELLTEAHVNRWNLDQTKAYIQVTHVQPYFEGQEIKTERQTRFEKNFNISRFMFETPFIQYPDLSNDQCLLKSGPKRTDDLSAQWKRRTILTTEQTFPNLKRRLDVRTIREVDLSPIESAMDAIRTKNNQLSSHLGIQTFSKLMDMHLQGALLTTVNQGPMAYAETFLKSEHQVLYPTDKVKEFKRLFLAFLSTCLALLRQYQELMPNELQEKCRAMRQALDNYRVELSNLMNEEILMDDVKKTFYTKTVLTIVKEPEKDRKNSEAL